MKLAVEKRLVTGKKVRVLRAQNKVPGVVYGRHLDTPVSVAFDRVELLKTFKKAGGSTAVELHGDGVDHLILFHDIQFHPVSDAVLHVDCIAVNKDEKTIAEVPVQLIGESPFEKDGLGSVQLIRTSLEVEAFPLDLPHHIEIDVSTLTEAGQVIHISDIKLAGKAELVGEPEITVVSTALFEEEETTTLDDLDTVEEEKDNDDEA